MESTDSYQGYANYETYLVCVWLDNDEPLYDEGRALSRDAAPGPDDEEYDKEYAERQAAEALKAWVADLLSTGEDESGLRVDLVAYALSAVDWREVARTRLEDE